MKKVKSIFVALVVMTFCFLNFNSTVSAQAQDSQATELKINNSETIGSTDEITDDVMVTVPTLPIQRNTIYVELGLNGNAYTINYDKILFSTPKFKVSSRLGFGFNASSMRNDDFDATVPVAINALFGKSKHKLEVSAGVLAGFGYQNTPETLGFTENGVQISKYTPAQETTNVYLTPAVSYRYQSNDGGLFLKAGVTPSFMLYSRDTNIDAAVWTNVAVGYTLKQKDSKIPMINY